MATDERADRLNFTLTDYANDVRQAMTAINADQNLSGTSRSQLEQLLRKTDAIAVALANGEDPSTVADEDKEAKKSTSRSKS